MDPLVVRETEARQLLGGISRETLWRLRKAGRIESFTVGSARLYPVDALRRFVAEQRVLAHAHADRSGSTVEGFGQ